MGLQIRRTGIGDYLPGGTANIQMLVIGGPGVGKTRMSSFWPKVIYADCESGRGSLVDRNTLFAEITSSQEMLEFLAFLKEEQRKQPDKLKRDIQTVVIDTLDGYARKVQDEWLQQNRAQAFKGFEAWAYLDIRMKMLMTRLLNLDYNVLVLVHYKSKSGGDGPPEITLQLQGDIKDTVFNDFDLVGWLGTFWDSENGERVEKRGLTFKKTPDRPFLKDRFGCMPSWIPITFDPADHSQLLDAFMARAQELEASGVGEGEIVGEIPSFREDDGPPRTPHVASADQSGPVNAVGKSGELPLNAYDKPTLIAMAREVGILVRGNMLKSELVEAIQQARDASSASRQQAAPADAEPGPAALDSARRVPAPVQTVLEPLPEGGMASVNAATGEIIEVTEAEALSNLEHALGATEVAVTNEPAQPDAIPVPAEAPALLCSRPDCDTDLNTVDQRWRDVSRIRFGKEMCEPCYQAAKKR